MEKKKVIKLFWFLFILIVVFLPGYSKFQELAQKNRALQDRIRQLESSNRKMSNELGLLKEDPVYIEKIAREKLKVTKKGEVIYRMPPQEDPKKR